MPSKPKHKRPKLIEVIEGDLPRNFLGKVLRRKLREAGVDEAIGDSTRGQSSGSGVDDDVDPALKSEDEKSAVTLAVGDPGQAGSA